MRSVVEVEVPVVFTPDVCAWLASQPSDKWVQMDSAWKCAVAQTLAAKYPGTRFLVFPSSFGSNGVFQRITDPVLVDFIAEWTNKSTLYARSRVRAGTLLRDLRRRMQRAGEGA